MPERNSRNDQNQGRSNQSRSNQGGSNRSRSRGQSSSDSSNRPEFSLQEREYRDKNGQIHHHTNTYMEQHKGDRSGGGSSRGSNNR